MVALRRDNFLVHAIQNNSPLSTQSELFGNSATRTEGSTFGSLVLRSAVFGPRAPAVAPLSVVIPLSGVLLWRSWNSLFWCRTGFSVPIFSSGSTLCHPISRRPSYLSRFIFDMTPPKIESFVEKIVATNPPRASENGYDHLSGQHVQFENQARFLKSRPLYERSAQKEPAEELCV